MTHLPGVLQAAVEVQAFCEDQQWRFCFIGGVAVQRWGSPRVTQDVDLTLLTGFGQEEPFIDKLLSRFLTRRADSREFALRHRVLLARTLGGIDVDVALGAFPFEQRSIERASAWTLDVNAKLTTCCAEDLVIQKVFAARDRDWSDVETILARNLKVLDLRMIRTELIPLLELKEQPQSLDKFDRMVAAVRQRLKL